MVGVNACSNSPAALAQRSPAQRSGAEAAPHPASNLVKRALFHNVLTLVAGHFPVESFSKQLPELIQTGGTNCGEIAA
jgi:hypothetical protein